MKNVVTTPEVDFALRTLDLEEVRQVQTWVALLKNWDGDPLVREQSRPLAGIPQVHVAKTSLNLRIFFKVEGDTITILDVAQKQGILRTTS